MTEVRDDAEYRKLVGRRIVVARKWNSMNQTQLAEKAGPGIKRMVLSSYERGEQKVDAWRMWLIADALNVEFLWLVSRNTDTGPFPSQQRNVRVVE